jgi:hypothetical protein
VRFFACDFWDGTDAQCDLFQDVAGISFPVLLDADGLGAPDMYNCSYHYVIIVDGNGIVQYRGSTNLAVIEAVLEAAVDNLVGVAVGDVPGAASLLGANYPNPFNPSTRIPFEVPAARDGQPVRLEVLDQRGRQVRTLVAGSLPAGRHEAVFDGRDRAGNAVPSGGYLARLRLGDAVESRIMSLVK